MLSQIMAGRGKGRGRREVPTIPSVDEDRNNANKIKIMEEKMKEQGQLLALQNSLIERQGSQITEMMNIVRDQRKQSQATTPSRDKVWPRGGVPPVTTNIIAKATATTTTAIAPLVVSDLAARNVTPPMIDSAPDVPIEQSKIMKDFMRLEKKLKLVLHFDGKFVNNPILRYINGLEYIFNGFDPNFLSISRIEKMLEVGMICTSVGRICILEPSKTLNDGLYWVTDDDDIKTVMRLIMSTSTELHVFVVDEDDADNVIPEANDGVEEENNEARQHDHIGAEPEMYRTCDEAVGPECVHGRDLGLSSYWDLNGVDEGATGNNATRARRATANRSKSIVRHNGSLNEADRDIIEVGVDAESAYEQEADITKDQEYDNNSNNPTFTLGMVFQDAQQLREAVDKYAITRGIQLVWVKNEPKRLRAKCQPQCPFVLFASGIRNEQGLKIKTLNLKHKCRRIFQNKRCSAKYLVGYFKEKILEKPNITVKEMKAEVERDLKVQVSECKCKRAKRILIEGMDDSFREKCKRLKTPKTSNSKKRAKTGRSDQALLVQRN
ncbi:hypothetical protein Syun_012336 [Stephania yunnanensis]|uniref:Transposase MuDR plant domain-containing protein n=1 Tax=Stephania yunnanensis TaxID=152371 RepID=A0AAP0JZG2_9MAGN